MTSLYKTSEVIDKLSEMLGEDGKVTNLQTFRAIQIAREVAQAAHDEIVELNERVLELQYYLEAFTGEKLWTDGNELDEEYE